MKKLVICFSIGILNLLNAQNIDTLVDVGDFKLHFNVIKGKGMPILFESGNGDDASVWKEILLPIHDSTGATIITYDRAGLGSSSIDTSNINIKNEVDALGIGLKKLGYTKDIFIVSHSFGSYYTTLFALKNPRKTKGIVFIDVLTPCYFTKQRAMDTKNSIGAEDWLIIKKEAIGLYYVLRSLDTIYEYTKDKKIPPGIPLTVIGADVPPKIVKENEIAEWKNCLKTFGNLRKHRYVFAKNCGHKVWNDNPILVINEISRLYREVVR